MRYLEASLHRPGMASARKLSRDYHSVEARDLTPDHRLMTFDEGTRHDGPPVTVKPRTLRYGTSLDPAMPGQDPCDATKCYHELKIVRPERHPLGLLLCRLHSHEVHGRTPTASQIASATVVSFLCRFTSISAIGFAS